MNTTRSVLLLGLALASASALPATIHFQNTGVISGWTTSDIDGTANSVAQVTGYTWPSNTSGSSLRFTVSYPGYRAEQSRNASGLGERGNTRYYGFAMYIDSAWQNMSDRDAYFCQNIGDYNANCPGTSGEFAPSFFFGSRGGDFKSIYYTGDPCGDTTPTAHVTVLRSLLKGQWVRVVYRATWKSDSTGRLEVWINGVKHQDFTGANTFPFTTRLVFKAGLYIPGWRTSQGSSTQVAKKVWIDHWRIGDSYNEVDPASW
jgi:hypothetical protein